MFWKFEKLAIIAIFAFVLMILSYFVGMETSPVFSPDPLDHTLDSSNSEFPQKLDDY